MLLDNYQSFIHKSRYARYLDDKGRRENWEETVNRYCAFMGEHTGLNLYDLGCYDAIYNLEVMPSMRALMTAGPALARDHVAGYNCAYVAIDDPKAFDESFFILLNGTGIGYSVERQYIANMPVVADSMYKTESVVHVRDSKLGWAKALRELIALLYQGQIPEWDVSKVRPAGARLKTFGGRASGPEPLVKMFNQVISVFKKAVGRKLNSIECHDIMCYIADAVVVGGVRRSAMISLSNLSDDRMRVAKSGDWRKDNGQRQLANNSACYTEKPEMGAFMREWSSIYESKSGERGIFNRVASQKMSPERRDGDQEFGTNPCSEIVLRSGQFCNLTEIVCRSSDTLEDLKRKAEIATILGTCQSSLTEFRYLRAKWRKNTEEEALLGVSMTGIYDCPAIYNANPEQLQALRDHTVEVNKKYAAKIGVNESAAITCVKPSGTVSQLVDSASGIHPRYNPFYIRRVRNDKKDPLSDFMREVGVPNISDPWKESNWVFEYPTKAPEGAITRNDVTAIDQLTIWKRFALNWCEHKPSITIYIKEHEWMSVGAWVWENFDIVNGISFLPSEDDGHIYDAAPNEDITEERYEELLKDVPIVKWDDFHESEDTTTSSQEMACSAGGCELT